MHAERLVAVGQLAAHNLVRLPSPVGALLPFACSARGITRFSPSASAPPLARVLGASGSCTFLQRSHSNLLGVPRLGKGQS